MRHDGDDPYLVVAADKGTGSFSDVANELAAEYGYWLGDAFASGGSAGFDHKEMGITSRGAWISVQAHFRALGVDADTAPLHGRRHRRHVGRRVRQRPAAVAAPAAARRVRPPPRVRRSRSRSRRELRRAATAVRAPGVVVGRLRPDGALRRGRGVRAQRRSRSTSSPAARARARRRRPAAHPRRAGPRDAAGARRPPVERRDRHVREGEHRVRRRRRRPHQRRRARRRHRAAVPGGRPRAATSGFTQRARVEYALAGGRINTDAIDNSAGVDCSDHEVNIKILLQRAIAAGVLDADDARRAPRAHDRRRRRPRARRQRGPGERAGDRGGRGRQPRRRARAPDGAARAVGADSTARSKACPRPRRCRNAHAAGVGLTSPELAVLLAYTKLELQRALVASDVPDDPYLHDALRRRTSRPTCARVTSRRWRRTRYGGRSSPP